MTKKMSKERWQKIQSILDDILELESSQKKAYLDRIGQSDEQLRAEIEQFLAAEEDAPTFLDQSAASLAKAFFPDESERNQDAVGTQLGPYRLVQEIGRGGMGVVYLGERQTGEFEQQVAIKILTETGSGGEKKSILLDRFHQEQQTLALLNHANIAQLFDGGFTPQGQPYIVMEYIQGQGITHYCKAHKLALSARIELIIQIADVLAFTHQNLIIHRDLKPSNILINAEGQVKLLDFGIAKLISEETFDDLTKTGDSVMTPGAAAPEQIKKQPITVATDVYQLGLVMYELITGHKAFSDKADSLYALAKVVCEQAPTLPSRLNNGIQVDNSSWSKKLQGDLDAITLKALRTEPESRYSTMAEFAQDLHAHLHGELVEARQKNMQYLVANFSRRHWKALSVALAFFAILLAYATTVTIQSQQIRDALATSELEAQKARQVSDFMIDIFKTSDPNVSGLQQINAQQLLEKGQQDIQLKLQQAPEIRAHMLGVLGDIYFSRGVYEQSDKLLSLALEQQRTLPRTSDQDIANISTKLATSYSAQNRYEEADVLLQESLAYHQSQENSVKQEAQTIAYAETLNVYADLLKIRGEYQAAANHYQRSITLITPFGEQHNELAIAFNGLAGAQHVQGQFDSAIVNMREGLRILGLVHGEQHAYYTIALNNLVTILTDLEHFEEATRLSKKSLSIQTDMLGEDHPNVGNTLRSLGILSHRQGELALAKDYLQKALQNKRQNLNKDNVTIGVILLFLGAAVQDAGEFDLANQHYQSMLSIFRQYQVADRIMGRALCQPASLWLATGNWENANRTYAEALALLPEQGVRTAIAQLGFARSAFRLNNQWNKAEGYARAALTTRMNKYPPEHSLVAEAQAVLGLLLFKNGEHSEALPLLRSANTTLSQHPLFVKMQGADNLILNIRNALNQAENQG